MSDEHEHIVKSFSEDLIQLKNMILKMAGLVENQLQLSLDSIPVSYTHLTLPTNREV